MIQKMLDQLEIYHILLHANQAIYSKILIIQGLNQGKYDQIIIFLLRRLPNHNSQFEDLWKENADVIAQGSADQVMKRRHYHRSIRLQKQAIEALLRYRMKGVLNKG